MIEKSSEIPMNKITVEQPNRGTNAEAAALLGAAVGGDGSAPGATVLSTGVLLLLVGAAVLLPGR